MKLSCSHLCIRIYLGSYPKLFLNAGLHSLDFPGNHLVTASFVDVKSWNNKLTDGLVCTGQVTFTFGRMKQDLMHLKLPRQEYCEEVTNSKVCSISLHTKTYSWSASSACSMGIVNANGCFLLQLNLLRDLYHSCKKRP